ncbi:MAG: patatin family protein, partial [Oscillospiraceae bacterium]|nr:patatin family protein [Oscillospiraceae bacterium]
NRNVLILTQPKGYRKKKSRMLPLMRLALLRYSAVSFAMAQRHHCYNNQMDEIDQKEASGESFVIRPPHPLGIGRTENNPEELERVYQIGRREAEIRLEEIKTFLKDDPCV